MAMMTMNSMMMMSLEAWRGLLLCSGLRCVGRGG